MVDLCRQRIANSPPKANLGATSARVVSWLAIGSIYVGLLIMYAWNQQVILGLQYELEDLKRTSQRLSDQRALLTAEYKSLTAPKEITQRARDLGMISSANPLIEIIQATDPEKVRGLLARARTSNRLLLNETK